MSSAQCPCISLFSNLTCSFPGLVWSPNTAPFMPFRCSFLTCLSWSILSQIPEWALQCSGQTLQILGCLCVTSQLSSTQGVCQAPPGFFLSVQWSGIPLKVVNLGICRACLDYYCPFFRNVRCFENYCLIYLFCLCYLLILGRRAILVPVTILARKKSSLESQRYHF